MESAVNAKVIEVVSVKGQCKTLVASINTKFIEQISIHTVFAEYSNISIIRWSPVTCIYEFTISSYAKYMFIDIEFF